MMVSMTHAEPPTQDRPLSAGRTVADVPSPLAGRPAGVRLRGVAFDQVSEAQTVRYIADRAERGRGGWVITSNLDHLVRAGRDDTFRKMLEEADLVVADGAPLIWASKAQGTPLPERVAGSSLVWTLSEELARRGLKLFLLGGDPGTAEASAEVLTDRYPGLEVVGHYCPPMGFEQDLGEMTRIREALRESQADVVYVALGSPKQERLIQTLRGGVSGGESEDGQAVLPDAWWMGVGISLSFICGQVQRAPRWMQRCGLEWAHRLVQEPRRLVRRYLVDGIPFALWLLWCSGWTRVAGGRERLIRPAQAQEASSTDVSPRKGAPTCGG